MMFISDTENGHPDVEIGISIIDILDYVGESVRPIKEGYAVYAADHIVCIGYRENRRNDMLTEVIGYVTQTSHPGLAPHEVILWVGRDIPDWRLKCSCKAGTGKCKHIVACLLHIEKYVCSCTIGNKLLILHELNSDNYFYRHPLLEYMSCTDVTQAWGISKAEKKAKWGAKRVKDLCCVNKPKLLEVSRSNREDEENILTTSFNRILNGIRTFYLK